MCVHEVSSKKGVNYAFNKARQKKIKAQLHLNIFKGAYLSANQVRQSYLISHNYESKLVTKKIIAAHIICVQARELHA